jgi:NADP-dependent 3-hydroxy acid dehydrogenase YdfG
MKTVLITGCSSGFGKEMTEVLAGKGFKVVSTMRNVEARKQLFDHLPDDVKIIFYFMN